MHFAFTDEQEEFRKGARRFLEKFSDSGAVRRAMASDDGFDRDVWRRICEELGWTALVIPEAFGGFGFSWVDVTAVMEEMGRSVLCAPYFSTVCLATNALLEAGTDAQKQAWLPGIAAGETFGTLAATEANGRYDVAGVETTFTNTDAGYVLNGTKRYVVDAHIADVVIVVARQQGSSGQDGVALFVVPANTPGVTCAALPTVDQTRRQGTVTLDNVTLGADALMADAGWAAYSRIVDRASALLAAEQVGGAQACLDMAVEYMKVRQQFGQAIGTFQGLKHMAADMMMQIECGRSAAYYAGWAAEHAPEQLATVAPQAAIYCGEAYFHCAAQNIQMHGGIGVTWEHDAHLYFKRAKSAESLLGDPAFWRQELGDRYGF